MRTSQLLYVVFALLFFAIHATLAVEIPAELRKFLSDRGQQRLIEQFDAIPRVSPEEFTRRFDADKAKLAGSGWNGIAYRGDSNNVYKVAHAVFGSQNVKPAWTSLTTLPSVSADQFEVHKMIDFEVSAARRPTQKELFGTLLWSAYYPQATEYLPDLISTDGFAYRRKFVPGTPLDKILHGKNPGYDMRKIWGEIAWYQDVAQLMLLDSGVMVDLLSPANFIVSGTHETPTLELVDHEFVAPTKQAREFYAQHGRVIPEPTFTQGFEMIRWPLMPEHIVQSKNWNLSFEQALEYVSVRKGTTSRALAINALASMPIWENELFPFLVVPENVEKARELAKSNCAEILLGR